MAEMSKEEALNKLRHFMETATYVDRSGQRKKVLTFRAGTRAWEVRGRGQTPLGVLDEACFEWRMSESRVLAVIRKLGTELVNKALDEVADRMAHFDAQGVDDTAARQMLRALEHSDTDDELHECNLWALKQWIWQAKRHALDREVDYHSMLVFWGVQGSGKSEAVKRLIRPMKEFCKNAKATQFNDQFSIRLFADSLLCWLDEFAGAKEVDPAIFKALISGGDLEGRAMYADSAYFSKNRLTFVATSNLAPPHGYRDPTGARRLWPIHCTDIPIKHDKRRRDILDGLDWSAVWRCASGDWDNVEHSIPKHLQARMDTVRDNQVRSRHAVEGFADECLEPADPKDRTPLKEVREVFNTWLRTTRNKESDLTLPNLQALLESIGLKCVNRQRYRFLCGHRLTSDHGSSNVNPVKSGESQSSPVKAIEKDTRAAS